MPGQVRRNQGVKVRFRCHGEAAFKMRTMPESAILVARTDKRRLILGFNNLP